MHLATTEAIRRAANGQSVTQAVSYSLRYNTPTLPNCTSVSQKNGLTSDTLPATLFRTFNKSLALSNLHPSTLDYHIRNSLHQLHIDPRVDPLPHMATLLHKLENRERAYRNILRTTISTLWRLELLNNAPLHLPHMNCRKASNIHIARDDLQRRYLFKPAQYLRSQPLFLASTVSALHRNAHIWNASHPLLVTYYC